MRTRGYAATDVGMRRSNNEDTHLVDEAIGLYVVCDGMGGHAAGEVASLEAATSLRNYLADRIVDVDNMRASDDFKGIQDLIVDAVRYASKHVLEHAQLTGQHNMGTTLTLLLAAGDRAVIASVGDSRAYHCRKKFVKLLTKDHTLAYELQRQGQITAEQVRDHPFAHYLTRTIGVEEEVEVDILVAYLVAGDIFLLCTDGLSNYFDHDEELGEYMFSKPANIPTELVSMANERGGKDNITAIVVQVMEEPAVVSQQANRKWFTRIA